MSLLIKTTLAGIFFGTFGTMLGGILGLTTKNLSERFIAVILAITAGLMSSIVCFELIPQSIVQSNLIICIIGILFGTIVMRLSEIIIDNKCSKIKKNKYLKTGLIIALGLTFHNIPEGLAIGTRLRSRI